MGSIASDTNALFYQVHFINESPYTLLEASVEYDGEQWRVDSSNDTIPDRLQFFYRIGSNDLSTKTNNAGWTPVPALDFLSRNNSILANGQALDSRDNRTLNISATFPILLPPGEGFLIRWYDANDSGGDHGLAIDDLRVRFRSNPFLSTNTLTGVTIELARPKVNNPLKYKARKGFKVKGYIKTPDKVNQVLYAAIAGTNLSTNTLRFATAIKLKEVSKIRNPNLRSKLMQRGIKYIFSSKANRAGSDILPGSQPVTLFVQVRSTGDINSGVFTTNFIFNNTKIK